MKNIFLLLLLMCLVACSNPLKNMQRDTAQAEFSHTALKVAKPTSYRCIVSPYGKICGYDCKVAGSYAKCANFPSQRCLVGSDNYIACGYHCKKTAREARCGIRYGDRCYVIAATGEVICGLNCRPQGDFVYCDPSPPYREEFPLLHV